MYSGCFILSIIFICSFVKSVVSLEKEMTINVDAGKEMCFFQNVKEGYVIDLEYQVIDGSHGELDINFQLVEPTGRIMFADFKKLENNHRTEVKVDGDYKFCWDNSFSSFNSKTIFFEIIVEGDEEDEDDWNDVMEGLTPDEFYDMKIQDIQDAISRVRSHLSKVRHLQDAIRSHEARDRNIAEENFFKVNSWSIIQIFVMISVGIIQVIMVRSLFDDSSRVHRLLRSFK